MTLYDKIMILYPSLDKNNFMPITGTIILQNDSDGKGDYIKYWNHPSLPKPTQEQLNNIN